MDKYCEIVDGWPLWLRIILALPVFDGVVYGLYRACKDIKNPTNVVFGIIWFLLGSVCMIGAIVDIVTLVLDKKISVLCADDEPKTDRTND